MKPVGLCQSMSDSSNPSGRFLQPLLRHCLPRLMISKSLPQHQQPHHQLHHQHCLQQQGAVHGGLVPRAHHSSTFDGVALLLAQRRLWRLQRWQLLPRASSLAEARPQLRCRRNLQMMPKLPSFDRFSMRYACAAATAAKAVACRDSSWVRRCRRSTIGNPMRWTLRTACTQSQTPRC